MTFCIISCVLLCVCFIFLHAAFVRIKLMMMMIIIIIIIIILRIDVRRRFAPMYLKFAVIKRDVAVDARWHLSRKSCTLRSRSTPADGVNFIDKRSSAPGTTQCGTTQCVGAPSSIIGLSTTPVGCSCPTRPVACSGSILCFPVEVEKCKGSPYSITEHRVP